MTLGVAATPLEPWHSLRGEEASGSGTVRNVDSSVERLQVKISGMTGQRFMVACNGRRVPLHPTGERGEFVAGVRYRAWQPPSCLHPNIPVHSPLALRYRGHLVRTARVGGCTYHVMHSGGRANDQFPVNAQEAESRRLARFQDTGHTAGLNDCAARGAQSPVPVYAGFTAGRTDSMR